MVYTSSYINCNTNKYHTLSISKDKGLAANYNKDYYLKLAPLETFFRVWRNNPDNLSEEENNKYYIREYYYNVLEKLDPSEVYKEIDNSILLCYEDNDMFCHRHIVSAWLELFLNIVIFEVKENNGSLEIVDRPGYIKDYLLEVIKELYNIVDNVTINELYRSKKKKKV